MPYVVLETPRLKNAFSPGGGTDVALGERRITAKVQQVVEHEDGLRLLLSEQGELVSVEAFKAHADTVPSPHIAHRVAPVVVVLNKVLVRWGSADVGALPRDVDDRDVEGPVSPERPSIGR